MVEFVAAFLHASSKPQKCVNIYSSLGLGSVRFGSAGFRDFDTPIAAGYVGLVIAVAGNVTTNNKTVSV